MSAQNTSKRLTANTFTPAFLEEIIMQTQGLLGFYEIKEYELLKTLILHLDPIQWTEDEEGNSVPQADYEVRWIPFKMDPKSGRLKLQPVSKRGIDTLDRAHANKIMERNPWLRRFNAIGFVKNIKRHQDVFRNAKVQDFLLRRHGDSELHNLLDDKEHFKAHIIANMRDDFSHRQLEAIHMLLPRVHEVMQRTPNTMKQRNAEQKAEAQSQESESDSQTQAAATTTEAEEKTSESEAAPSTDTAPNAETTEVDESVANYS